MKKMVKTLLVGIGCASLILAIISRFTMNPLPIVRGGGMTASALLLFANTCLVLAIALILMEKK